MNIFEFILISTILLFSCSSKRAMDERYSCNNIHAENISEILHYIDSVSQAGATGIKEYLVRTYDYIGEVHNDSMTRKIDTINTSFIEVVPVQLIFHPLEEGFIIQYAYKFSDTSQHLWEIPFIAITPPFPKTDFLYPPMQLFIPDSCTFRLIEYSSEEYWNRKSTVVMFNKTNPSKTYSFGPQSIDITNMPHLETSDILLAYSHLELCILFGPVP